MYFVAVLHSACALAIASKPVADAMVHLLGSWPTVRCEDSFILIDAFCLIEFLILSCCLIHEESDKNSVVITGQA